MRKQAKESGPITTFQIFALGGLYLVRAVYVLTRYFHPLYDDDDGDGGDDEGNGVWSHYEGGIDYCSGAPLSLFRGDVSVCSFVLLSCRGQQHHRKNKRNSGYRVFFVFACLSSPASGDDCAGRGNGLSFFLFSCDPSTFFHAYQG